MEFTYLELQNLKMALLDKIDKYDMMIKDSYTSECKEMFEMIIEEHWELYYKIKKMYDEK